MRSAPAVRVVVHFGGAWRAAVCGWALVSGGIGTWWLIQLQGTLHPGIAAVVGASILACVTSAVTATHAASRRLHWDGQLWRLHGIDARGAQEGRLCAVVDFGAWMLLRFDADLASTAQPGSRISARRCWLPVQRRGREREWHALRCAVHAPPSAGPAA